MWGAEGRLTVSLEKPMMERLGNRARHLWLGVQRRDALEVGNRRLLHRTNAQKWSTVDIDSSDRPFFGYTSRYLTILTNRTSIIEAIRNCKVLN